MSLKTKIVTFTAVMAVLALILWLMDGVVFRSVSVYEDIPSTPDQIDQQKMLDAMSGNRDYDMMSGDDQRIFRSEQIRILDDLRLINQ
jgi:hypothetical protein